MSVCVCTYTLNCEIFKNSLNSKKKLSQSIKYALQVLTKQDSSPERIQSPGTTRPCSKALLHFWLFPGEGEVCMALDPATDPLPSDRHLRRPGCPAGEAAAPSVWRTSHPSCFNPGTATWHLALTARSNPPITLQETQ